MAVQNLTVIGSGQMGRGIAHVGMLGGLRTTLVDISEAILQKAVQNVHADLDKAIAIGKLTQEQKASALANLSTETDIGRAVQNADMVIEAVPEDMKLKLQAFGAVDKCAPPQAILASNTSSLSITEIAAATNRASNFLGMHFFNPVHKMKLLEIIKGLETSSEAIRIAEDVGKRMGKETVIVNEAPGFITSRINVIIGNEAFYLLQEGVATAEDIDKAVKLGLNHPMGPLEMSDLVGLDTRLHVLEYLHQTLGEKFRPCPLMAQYVKAGRLGRKVGRGVYDYPAQSPKS